jgi:hypothetical protein
MDEAIGRTAYSIINALEGYRIRLEADISTEDRSCLERIVQDTLKTALEYHLPIELYQRWFIKYSERSNRKISTRTNDHEEEDNLNHEKQIEGYKELEEDLDGWLG